MEVKTLKKKLKSGADLEVWLASFRDGHNLFKAVAREIEGIDLKNDLEKMTWRLLSSQAIENALWPCMTKATYNAIRIQESIFEDEAIREDFIEVQETILTFNLSPFIKGLASQSKNQGS